MQLMTLNQNREARVSTIATRLQSLLFNYQGHIGAHCIIGGVDV